MGSVRRVSWAVAASVGLVEALKDQGFCRWNSTIRSAHQRAKNQLGSMSQAKIKHSPSSAPALASKSSKLARRQERAKQSEESLRKVMYLSCWGPN